jgi:hypothetical protein
MNNTTKIVFRNGLQKSLEIKMEGMRDAAKMEDIEDAHINADAWLCNTIFALSAALELPDGQRDMVNEIVDIWNEMEKRY